MTLRDSILSAVPTDAPISWEPLYHQITTLLTPSPSPDAFNRELDKLVKDRILVHTLTHSRSSYRQRTPSEFAQLQAELTGVQGRLL
jgi:hypothetical protein